MKSFQENSHAFIIRVWLEPREIEGERPEWRGTVEHVLSGERRSVHKMEEVVAFIASYMQDWGVKLDIES